MSISDDPKYQYNMTIKMFGSQPEPPFETAEEVTRVWGRNWGVDNDVGQIRSVLMHRPGSELSIVDTSKRIDQLGTYGDLEAGWYWQSSEVPPIADMQQQHDALVRVLETEGVEVEYLEGVESPRLKSCYTRDPLIMVKGGAIVCRMAPHIRRGEELPVTRTLARLGVPVLRTIHSNGIIEGGSFAWLNSSTAVIGRSIRVNDEAISQLDDVLKRQGVELLVVDLCGYQIHIDGAFVMINPGLAMVDPSQLPYWFLQKLKSLDIDSIEISPADNSWIINCLAISPGRVIMPEGASPRVVDELARHSGEVISLDYDQVQLNGGGIHCSTCPLIRDPV